MKNLLIIAAISLGTITPCFAQKTPAAEPFLRSYDELREVQQKKIMHTWNVVDTAPELLRSSRSYDELHEAQKAKIMRTWNAVQVVRATTEPEASGEEVSKEAPEGAVKDYVDQNREQINMNAAIKAGN